MKCWGRVEADEWEVLKERVGGRKRERVGEGRKGRGRERVGVKRGEGVGGYGMPRKTNTRNAPFFLSFLTPLGENEGVGERERERVRGAYSASTKTERL